MITLEIVQKEKSLLIMDKRLAIDHLANCKQKNGYIEGLRSVTRNYVQLYSSLINDFMETLLHSVNKRGK